MPSAHGRSHGQRQGAVGMGQPIRVGLRRISLSTNVYVYYTAANFVLPVTVGPHDLLASDLDGETRSDLDGETRATCASSMTC